MARGGRWTKDDIPDQAGRVAIVTGSNTGIGYETARMLAERNAKVVLAVRNIRKGEDAAARIRLMHGSADLAVMMLDLSSLRSVADFAAQYGKMFPRLDLLINNAGVMAPPYTKTEDGFELQFGTNHLGHFALTGLLMDILLRTKGSRVVNVSSTAHRMGRIDFDDLDWRKRAYSRWRAYGDSKIANLYFTFELDRRLRERGKTAISTAAHPGFTATDLQRTMGMMRHFINVFAQGPSMGALPTLRAATDKDAAGGEFFGPGGLGEIWGYPVRVVPNRLSQDKKIGKSLWEVSEGLTGVSYNLV